MTFHNSETSRKTVWIRTKDMESKVGAVMGNFGRPQTTVFRFLLSKIHRKKTLGAIWVLLQSTGVLLLKSVAPACHHWNSSVAVTKSYINKSFKS